MTILAPSTQDVSRHPAPHSLPFADVTPLPQRSPLRNAITQAWRLAEPQALPALIESARLPAEVASRSRALAQQIVKALRERKGAAGKAGLVQGLLQEFSLSSQEGVALMCLAEALLRIPDKATRDALIRDKIGGANWKEHVGQSPSVFVNAAAWGLMLTGKLVDTHSETGMSAALGRIVAKGGEPLIRKAVDVAMRMMGEQFVTGETIEQALQNARKMEARGFRYSYDMLGEAAMTAQDAKRYLADYERAIHAIGKASAGRGIYEGPGISIKLSALHARYSRAQIERVHAELYPVLLGLARLARQYDIGLNIDAEEADRLELSLDLLERLCFAPELADWQGIGFVIQAYQKRCPFAIDYLIDLAQRSRRRLMIRLVKGAYWDTEIKRAQVDGMSDYPVYTRKAYTDISYIACARKLLAAPKDIYPQFATHNAQTLAAVYELAGPADYTPGQYEFQCLHGMGEPLYEQVVDAAPGKLGRPCRIYAPVGTHETLLAYLVRRLLENGANTSFVNRVADKSIPLDALVQDPIEQAEAWAHEEGLLGASHPGIPLPADLYGRLRPNSHGIDLASDEVLAGLVHALGEHAQAPCIAAPLLADATAARTGADLRDVINPANHADHVGQVRDITPGEIETALEAGAAYAPTWASVAPGKRADVLVRAADLMEQDADRLMGILVREAGKTYANAVAEVREAVDFLRHYAAQVHASFDNATHLPLGPIVCISPWNFPLAIFTGQVAAALAAGNTVLAKPAEQTSLVAAQAVQLLWAAGVPRAAVQLIPGSGRVVGPLLTSDARVQGVMFTGSTEVARSLQGTLAQRLSPAGRPIPLVAETGGQNAMIVDSSALAEQVVQDVIMSAFDSAGQRCSALRVLCVQDDVADRLVTMLKGAMRELQLGDPMQLRHDVGPVIDARARDSIDRHIEALRAKGRVVHQLAWGPEQDRQKVLAQGTYVPPTLIELESLTELTHEVFGPVLHLVRYRRDELDTILAQIKATGYGLTMGLHTRIDETIEHVTRLAHVGNLYINRNMVGAVVGVQPFGGEGLSGTGPKAGGPLYLYRLLAKRPSSALDKPFGTLESEGRPAARAAAARAAAARALAQLHQWAHTQGMAMPTQHAASDTPPFCPATHLLAGPTGERNQYEVLPRAAVLCVATSRQELVTQLAAVLSVGSRAVWDGACAEAASLHRALPDALRQSIDLASSWERAEFDVAIHHGDERALQTLLHTLAEREGTIVSVAALAPGDQDVPLERLVIERAISTNTAAAGGNASLMTMA